METKQVTVEMKYTFEVPVDYKVTGLEYVVDGKLMSYSTGEVISQGASTVERVETREGE